MSLTILISCNQSKEIPTPEEIDFEELPVQETIKPLTEETEKIVAKSDWNELLEGKEIETEKDIEVIKAIIEKAVEENRLEELQTYLEEEAKKEKVPPSILFSLSLVYGRKGLVKEEYKAIEALEEKVKQTPRIAFNLSLVYGRKEILKSQIEKAEEEALKLIPGTLVINSNPSGSTVLVDGKELGLLLLIYRK